MNCNHSFKCLPHVTVSLFLQSFEANRHWQLSLDLRSCIECMEETLEIQASDEVGFSFLCLVCIFPCLIH